MTTLREGDPAPDFTGINQDGKEVSLRDFRGKKLILFFFPKAMTPGCTKEAVNLAENYRLLKEKGFEVLGVSPDPPERQKKFKEKYNLPFDLIADPDKKILNAYGVWGKKKMYGREYEGVHRTTFIIDENGRIEHIIRKVKTGDHARQILSLYES
ncbi:MAG: thioredoxin-dependent thiol peroxidase [Chlorobi bacterium]|nr:thioredoxin-dependent thiol peroxidase [Chlorobiota bacterium]